MSRIRNTRVHFHRLEAPPRTRFGWSFIGCSGSAASAAGVGIEPDPIVPGVVLEPRA